MLRVPNAKDTKKNKKSGLEAEIQAFFTDEIVSFFEEHQIYHLESNGEALVIFDKIKLARTDETIAFIQYGKELATLLSKQ